MGNCLCPASPEDAAKSYGRTALFGTLNDAHPVVPWSSDIELLSVLVEHPDSTLGFWSPGKLHDFLAKGDAKRDELIQRYNKLLTKQPSSAGLLVGETVRVSRSKVAALFFEAEAVNAEAKLEAHMETEVNLKVKLDNHYTRAVDEVQDVLLNVRLDASEGSNARTSLRGWKENKVVVYVVDKIYQTTKVTVEILNAKKVSVEATGNVDLQTQAGLRFRKVKEKEGLFHMEATDKVWRFGPMKPFNFAFGCWKLEFSGTGKLLTKGLGILPKPAGGEGSSTQVSDPEWTRPELATESGGIIILQKDRDTGDMPGPEPDSSEKTSFKRPAVADVGGARKRRA